MTNPPAPDPKAEFDVLFQAFAEIQRSLLENTTKVAGFFLLVIGWLATSENARSYLRLDAVLRYSAVGATILVTIAFCAVSWMALTASRDIKAQLNTLQYVSARTVSHREVTMRVLVCYIFSNVCLASLVVLTLLRTANDV